MPISLLSLHCQYHHTLCQTMNKTLFNFYCRCSDVVYGNISTCIREIWFLWLSEVIHMSRCFHISSDVVSHLQRISTPTNLSHLHVIRWHKSKSNFQSVPEDLNLFLQIVLQISNSRHWNRQIAYSSTEYSPYSEWSRCCMISNRPNVFKIDQTNFVVCL